jgi:type III pantothenate kinase
MWLAIDHGNTRTKVGLYAADGQIQGVWYWEQFTLDRLINWLGSQPVEAAILSATGKVPSEILEFWQAQHSFEVLSEKTPLPYPSEYTTPHTLGMDRKAVMAASYRHFMGEHCLVIDAGTCITYDFMTDTGCYLGGGIAPGMRMRMRAMHEYTARLPLATMELPDSFVGNSTITCLQSGAIWGTIAEVQAMITMYQAQYGEVAVILTGGDSALLQQHIVHRRADPNWVLEGLITILKFIHTK